MLIKRLGLWLDGRPCDLPILRLMLKHQALRLQLKTFRRLVSVVTDKLLYYLSG